MSPSPPFKGRRYGRRWCPWRSIPPGPAGPAGRRPWSENTMDGLAYVGEGFCRCDVVSRLPGDMTMDRASGLTAWRITSCDVVCLRPCLQGHLKWGEDGSSSGVPNNTQHLRPSECWPHTTYHDSISEDDGRASLGRYQFRPCAKS